MNFQLNHEFFVEKYEKSGKIVNIESEGHICTEKPV